MTLRELEIKVTGTNIRRTESDLAKLEAQANKAAAAISNLSSNIRGIPRVPSTGVGGIGGGGGGGGAAGGGGIASGASSVFSGLSGIIGKLGGAAGNAAGGLGSLAGGLGKVISGAGSAAGALGALGGPIGLAVGAAISVIGGAFNLLGNAFEGVIKIGGQLLGVLGDMIGGIVDMGLKAAETALSLGAMFAQQKFAEYVSYEQQVRGLAVYEDNAKSLTETLGRLRQIAKLPGLALPEVMKATTNLRAAGLGAETAENTILGFGRALASVGKGKADFAGALMAVQQIVTAGKLEGDEIRQLSERVPQIRKVLMKAFGSAKGEDISKKMSEMGLSVVDVVKQINTELLKIPATSAGVSTSLENVMDDLAEMTRPIGQGLAMMFTAAMPGMNNFVTMIGEVSKGIGEVFGAIANTGIIGEILGTIGTALKDALNVNSIQEVFTVALSYVGAFVQQLPALLKEGFAFLGNLWDTILPKLASGLDTLVFWFMTAFNTIETGIKRFMIFFGNTITAMQSGAAAIFKFQEGDYAGSAMEASKFVNAGGIAAPLRDMTIVGALQHTPEMLGETYRFEKRQYDLRNRMQSGGIVKGMFSDLTSGMKGAGLGGIMGEWNKIGGIAQGFNKRIGGAMGPLSDLPPGLTYGGRPDEGEIIPIPNAKMDTDNLKEIATNTKKTADSLSLRTQTIGGRDIAKIGVTGAEVQNAGIQTPGLRTAPSMIEEGLRAFYASEARKRGPAFAFRRV
jgi:tape measure domain-containing protein